VSSPPGVRRARPTQGSELLDIALDDDTHTVTQFRDSATDLGSEPLSPWWITLDASRLTPSYQLAHEAGYLRGYSEGISRGRRDRDAELEAEADRDWKMAWALNALVLQREYNRGLIAWVNKTKPYTERGIPRQQVT
jgi:hypothetical protein